MHNEEEKGDDGENDNNNAADMDSASDAEIFDETVMVKEEKQELQTLYRFVQNSQPTNDDITSVIIQQLNDVVDAVTDHVNQDEISREDPTTSSIQTITSLPYPPANQIGLVADHDRPYADYGHLDRPTIAKICKFNLQRPTSMPLSQIRLQRKSMAIIAWTNVSTEVIMTFIKREFPLEQIQYICIGVGMDSNQEQQEQQYRLEIQIIFKKMMVKKTRFLDYITQSYCNYHVTLNDRGWNEYIKKSRNCLEFGEFKSTKARGRAYWTDSSLQLTQLSSETDSSSVEVDSSPLIVQESTETTTDNRETQCAYCHSIIKPTSKSLNNQLGRETHP